ncbi:hypothetical protein Ahy_B02g057368 [Arachis hypogaea]|uniref:Uncharacterized protein n=1 Tax=Arachis hypogaea TaxID=3818 RepID=A0A445ABK6_ARAHY|nr:hypothetical protein Ahy_B02g057368 [Arachis hypogaea]
MSGYSSAVKLEIEKFDGRINFGLWQVQVKDVLIQSGLHKALKEKISEDKKYPHGITALPWIRMSCGNQVHNCTRALVGVEMQGRWLKNFQEKPIWKLHHEFSARFRSVPRRNSWSGLIPSEYTFMVEYDSSLNYDCRVWVYWGAGERKKSMCCNNFHIVIFSGCHLTTAVVFSPTDSQGDEGMQLMRTGFKNMLSTFKDDNPVPEIVIRRRYFEDQAALVLRALQFWLEWILNASFSQKKQKK